MDRIWPSEGYDGSSTLPGGTIYCQNVKTYLVISQNRKSENVTKFFKIYAPGFSS